MLFVIAPNWKLPKCPSTAEWINKLWYIHAMKHYITMRSGTQQGHATVWMNLRSTMLCNTKEGPLYGCIWSTRGEANLRHWKPAWWTWVEPSGRSIGELLQDKEGSVSWSGYCLHRWFHFWTFYWAVHLGEAFFSLCVAFQHKNKQKQAMLPNLTSQTPCPPALSHWYQKMMFWRWFSKNGRHHLS